MKTSVSGNTKEINSISESIDVVTEIREVATRRIWLAGPLYELLPVFYIVAGVLCLFGAVHVDSSYWAVPYVALCGLLCVHAGVLITRTRIHFRRQKRRESSAAPRD